MFILKKGHQPGVYVPLRALFLVTVEMPAKDADRTANSADLEQNKYNISKQKFKTL